MKKVCEILDEIAEESGTNNKLEILEKYKENKELKRVIWLTYNNSIVYHIKKIPKYNNEENSSMCLEKALDDLSVFYTREKTGNEASEYLRDMLSSLLSEDAKVIENIIGRDLKIGMNAKSFNKVLGKDFIPKTPYFNSESFYLLHI